MKIRVLMENTASAPEFLCEHGLSLWIEREDCRLLFDMGQSDKFAENAEKLGIDLGKADLAVLSHGHYDHGGGLKRFLELNQKAPVYLNRYAFEPHFNSLSGKEIGLDPALRDSGTADIPGSARGPLGKHGAVSQHGISAGVVPMDPSGLTTLREGKWIPEDFRHEQYLLLREKGKRILISGCSHTGIVNLMEWLKPDVLIGGFHLKRLDPEGEGKAALEQLAERLKTYDTVYYNLPLHRDGPVWIPERTHGGPAPLSGGRGRNSFCKEQGGHRLFIVLAGDDPSVGEAGIHPGKLSVVDKKAGHVGVGLEFRRALR